VCAKQRRGISEHASRRFCTTLPCNGSGKASARSSAAPGVDGVVWKEYLPRLDPRLGALHTAVHRGSYRAQPVRRTYIPKADGSERPLGIAALQDKIVQHAVVTVLDAIYESDFVGISYGFCPGRSQHDALGAVALGIEKRKINWVVDADFGKFFYIAAQLPLLCHKAAVTRKPSAAAPESWRRHTEATVHEINSEPAQSGFDGEVGSGKGRTSGLSARKADNQLTTTGAL
jgi:hypothetical protein